MSTKVGLLTMRLSETCSPSATARTSCVLPAPRGPTRATTAPGNSSSPRRRPRCSVADRSGSERVWVALIYNDRVGPTTHRPNQGSLGRADAAEADVRRRGLDLAL